MASALADIKVIELVRALALAWKNLAAYPPGHPALAASLEAVHSRLDDVRGPAGEVVFGIAADGLLYGDAKIDSLYAQKFAQALHVRSVALIRFDPGSTAADVETFLRLLGARDTGRIPISEELTAAGVMNIHLQPVDYSAVQMTSDLAAPLPEPEPKAKPQSLWEEILRALLAGRELSAESREMFGRQARSVDQLAAMIMRYVEGELPDADFDPGATFGIKFAARVPQSPAAQSAKLAGAIARYIGEAKGSRKQVGIQQVLQLLRTLPQPLRGEVLRAVVEALAVDENAAPLRDFAAELPHDEVLEALRHLAGSGKISEHALTLLRSLMSAHKPASQTGPAAGVIEDVARLLGQDDIDRFNPPDHQALLDQIAIEVPKVSAAPRAIDILGSRVDTVTEDALRRQSASTLLDLLGSLGASRDCEPVLRRLRSTFAEFLAARAYGDAADIIEHLQTLALVTGSESLRGSIEQTLEQLASGETIDTLLKTLHDAPPEIVAAIQRLIELLGVAASRALLIALADEDNLGRRRRLFDFAVALGPSIVPAATKFLEDNRWYVVRNMILLLRGVNDRSSLPDIRRCARHPDLRVRMEAIKTLLAFEPAVPRALLEEAIHASDPKLAEAAITLVGNYGIKEAVDPLLHVIRGSDIFGARRALRIRVIKALGELGVPAALPRMQRFFSNSRLPWPARDERRAAFESLAGYAADARAALVKKGLASRDAAVRTICRRMAEPS